MTRVYEYDVFISYTRAGGNVPAWIRNHFYPRLTDWLIDNAERDVRIFFDENVGVGSAWPGELRFALQRTRILLPVCSPRYFRDEWCLAEWQSMAERERITGDVSRRVLICPVIFCDSQTFPNFAKQRRMRSFRDWNQPAPQFEATLGYVDFHREMATFAEDLVKLIDDVPPWRPDWPVRLPEAQPPVPARLPRF